MSRIPNPGNVVFVITWLSLPTVVCADWNVRNNLGERFTIYVWPSNNPSALHSRIIENGNQARIPLGQDSHQIELLSRGGDLYILEPAFLTKLSGVTDLKTILTPKNRKVRGRTVYQYMNQQGFNEGDSDRLDQLQWSAWRTTYDTPGGGSVTTDLKFADSVGTYYGGRGRLSEITYEQEGDHTVIRGKWVFDKKAEGRFTFYVANDDPNKFASTRDGGNSKWSGTRLTVAP
jgi:hypothetical protein